VPSLRALPFVLFALSVLAGAAPACSSSNAPPAAASDGGLSDDASFGDAGIGPFLCNLPVPATCPTTAPCTFAAWGCPQWACDGYFVVTDGTWIYYYSSVGGALAGEVLAADTSFVSCPYAFQPPTTCAPAIASQCALDGGAPAEGGSSSDGGSMLDGSTRTDSASPADGAPSADDGGSPDSASSSDGGNATDGS
jgi:hypothetical protein